MSQWRIRPVKVQKIPQRAAKAVVRIRIALRLYGLDAQSEISKYPTQEATAYVRSGILGQSWTVGTPKFRGPDLVSRVGNRRDYAARVQGTHQEQQFKDRGWPNIRDTNEKVWARHRVILVLAIKG